MNLEKNELFLTTTDTVIGLGGVVNNIVKKKIYQIKQRDHKKQLIIVVANIDQLKKIETINQNHLEYINKYWPGDTTLIINGQGYRMPNHPGLLELIEKEGPFYLTSANISNCETITDINEAKKIFPCLKVFDFGKGSNNASQIIDTDTGKRLR